MEMSGEEKPQRITELGQSTVVRLSIVVLVVGAAVTGGIKIGSIDEKVNTLVNAWAAIRLESRLTTIEVTGTDAARRLAVIEAEIKVLATAKRAELGSHLVRPTSGGTEDKSPLQQLWPIQLPP